jgi:Flp pilus assembly secretin CpaC
LCEAGNRRFTIAVAELAFNQVPICETTNLVSSTMKNKMMSLLTGASLVLLATTCVRAEIQTLTVAIDESHVLQLPAQPGAIIVGNPSVADVSIQGQKLIVHGRTAGHTNLIVLDLQGNQIAGFNLVGMLQQDSLLSVYRGPTRMSYTCAGTCQTNLQVGDDNDYFQKTLGQTTTKSGLATGSASAASSAPEAPQ